MFIKRISMTSYDAQEISRYLKILEGDLGHESVMNEDGIIDLGVSLLGASVNKVYHYENGTRWLKIVEDKGDAWVVESGYIGYSHDEIIEIEKGTFSSLIREMYVVPTEEENETLLEQRQQPRTLGDYISSIDRYLLANYGIDTSSITEDWKSLFDEGVEPADAAEYALEMRSEEDYG